VALGLVDAEAVQRIQGDEVLHPWAMTLSLLR
jgi:hypothetical protein